MSDRPDRWPRKELGHHGPKFGEYDRHEDQAEADMQPLGDLKEPMRFGWPREVGQVHPAHVRRERLVELRTVGDPVKKAGQENEGQ